MYKYYKKWLPLVMTDGIYNSVHDCDSITLQLDQITFSNGKGKYLALYQNEHRYPRIHFWLIRLIKLRCCNILST